MATALGKTQAYHIIAKYVEGVHGRSCIFVAPGRRVDASINKLEQGDQLWLCIASHAGNSDGLVSVDHFLLKGNRGTHFAACRKRHNRQTFVVSPKRRVKD
jgi:hypothetical protein